MTDFLCKADYDSKYMEMAERRYLSRLPPKAIEAGYIKAYVDLTDEFVKIAIEQFPKESNEYLLKWIMLQSRGSCNPQKVSERIKVERS